MNSFGLCSLVKKRFVELYRKLCRRFNHSGEFASSVARSSSEDFSLAVPFGYIAESAHETIVPAIICHIFHTDLADEIIGLLDNIRVPFKAFISTDTAEKKAVICTSLAKWSGAEVEIRICPNRGRDIAPKLITFADVYDQHSLVLFLHSKKSPHLTDGVNWREYLMRTLIGSPETVSNVLELFQRFPSLGMVIPQHYAGVRSMIAWGSNLSLASALALRMNFAIKADSPLDLPSGSMFWARSNALRPLLNLHLSINDFPIEAGQVDGTLAHAIERLLLYACEQAGYDWVKIADRQSSLGKETNIPVQNPSEVSAYLDNYTFRLLV